MKENSAHSHQLSEEEKKPFLTKEDAEKKANELYWYWEEPDEVKACINGFNAAAEKANAKIAELEKRYNDLSGALRFKYGEWENLKAENEQLEKRLTELEKERDKEIYSFLCFMVKDFGVQKLEPFVDWLRFVKDGSTYTFEELIALFRNQKVDKQSG